MPTPAKAKRYHNKLRAAGLCQGCRAPSPKRFCPACLAKINGWVKALHARRRAAGLCVFGKAPVPGGKQCPNCRARGRARWQARRSKKEAAAA